jgi:replicative DNA helicase
VNDVVPASIEHEQAVLGSTLVNSSALALCHEIGLQAEHFYTDRHRSLYRAVTHAEARGDELAAWASVEKLGLVSEALSRAYVSDLAARASFGSVRARAQRIVELANRRAKLEGAQLIQQGATELDEARSADLISEGMVLVTQDFLVDATPTSGEEVLDEIFDYFDTQEEGDVFRLPWPRLNDGVLGGYRRKQLSVFAGWTNMGKSYALDQMLDGFAHQGYRTAIFATEMSRSERAARWLASSTGIALEKILRNRLDADDHKRLAKARAAVDGRLPFDYYECQGWSADRIAERILSSGVDVAAIDPITEIPGFEKPETAAAITGRFAQVAARGDCHLIAVCHLNRARLKNPNGVKPKPLCLDLKGSGSLETLAHAVLFLHRDQDDAANVLPRGKLYFDKVRNGLKASVDVEQSPRRLRFVDVDDTAAQQELELGKEVPAHDREVFA